MEKGPAARIADNPASDRGGMYFDLYAGPELPAVVPAGFLGDRNGVFRPAVSPVCCNTGVLESLL